jgi:hypothetical protein
MRVYNNNNINDMQMNMKNRFSMNMKKANEVAGKGVAINIKSDTNNVVSSFTINKELQEENRRKTAWGAHIWTFLHTLSVKIMEESFPIVRTELMQLVNGIVTNLPCPTCSDHARDYMKNINMASIQTKEQFINFLYQFHNSVNARKGYPIYDRNDVEENYRKAILPNVYHNFELAYRDKGFNPSHIHDEYVRNRIIQRMRVWMSRNQEHFE